MGATLASTAMGRDNAISMTLGFHPAILAAAIRALFKRAGALNRLPRRLRRNRPRRPAVEEEAEVGEAEVVVEVLRLRRSRRPRRPSPEMWIGIAMWISSI